MTIDQLELIAQHILDDAQERPEAASNGIFLRITLDDLKRSILSTLMRELGEK